MTLERMLSAFLRFGSLAAVCVTAAGMVAMSAGGGLPSRATLAGLSGVDYGAVPGFAEWVTLAGLASLVLVSVGRLLMCATWFAGRRDRLLALMSMVTVLLVAVAALFRAV